jgi:hypothetical protein
MWFVKCIKQVFDLCKIVAVTFTLTQATIFQKLVEQVLRLK